MHIRVGFHLLNIIMNTYVSLTHKMLAVGLTVLFFCVVSFYDVCVQVILTLIYWHHLKRNEQIMQKNNFFNIRALNKIKSN